MIEFDLKEIKQKTSTGLTPFFNLANKYRWVDAIDITKDKRYEEVPLFDIPEEILKNEENFNIVRDSGIRTYVCFGLFTVDYRLLKKSRILFEIRPNKRLERYGYHNNHCWMNIHQINYWIDTMRTETNLDFFYKITEDDTNYHIFFDFKKLRKLQIKYILFWTRYLYEYPASFLALDAMLLKQQDNYKTETLQNLLTLVSDCQRNNGVRLTESQCLTTRGNFIQKEELQRRLQKRDLYSVRSLYSPTKLTLNRTTLFGKKLQNFYSVTNITGESWIDNKIRFDIYQEFFPLFKENEVKFNNKN